MSTNELSKTFQPLFDMFLETITQLRRISDDQWMFLPSFSNYLAHGGVYPIEQKKPSSKPVAGLYNLVTRWEQHTWSLLAVSIPKTLELYVESDLPEKIPFGIYPHQTKLTLRCVCDNNDFKVVVKMLNHCKYVNDLDLKVLFCEIGALAAPMDWCILINEATNLQTLRLDHHSPKAQYSPWLYRDVFGEVLSQLQANKNLTTLVLCPHLIEAACRASTKHEPQKNTTLCELKDYDGTDYCAAVPWIFHNAKRREDWCNISIMTRFGSAVVSTAPQMKLSVLPLLDNINLLLFGSQHTKPNQKELSRFSTSTFYLSHLSKNK